MTAPETNERSCCSLRRRMIFALAVVLVFVSAVLGFVPILHADDAAKTKPNHDLSFMQKGESYLAVQKSLRADGWKPGTNQAKGERFQAKRDRYGLPELEVCGPSGETCVMALVDGAGLALRVSTRGPRFVLTSWYTVPDVHYGEEDGSDEYTFFLAVLLIGLGVYFIPSFVAFLRGHPNRWPIALINVVFGGTVIGWVGSLIWAMKAVHKSPTGNDGGESGLNIFANDPRDVRIIADPSRVLDRKDVHESILRLKRLADEGAITAEEYASLRKRLLDRLSSASNER